MNLAKLLLVFLGLFVVILICNFIFLDSIGREKIVRLAEQRYSIETLYSESNKNKAENVQSQFKNLIDEINLIYLEIEYVAPLSYKFMEDNNVNEEKYFAHFELVMTNEEQKIENIIEHQLNFIIFNLLIFCFLFIFFLLYSVIIYRVTNK